VRISKRKLQRIIREEAHRLREDHIDTELDHLKKNVVDDAEHIKDLKDDIKDDHEEEIRAEKEKRKHESRNMSYRQLRRMIREEHQGYDAHEDEHLGMEHGPESEHEQDDHDRRDESEGDWGTRDNELHVHHHHHHDDQGYADREDERLAAEHGAEAGFEQSLKDRRDDAGFENESRRRAGRKLREAQLRRLIRRVARRR
jgi:hypothetical protein